MLSVYTLLLRLFVQLVVELFEFEVEYSDNSGKIFIIPTKGSISAINRDGEELSVSVKNKKWSSID